MTDPSTRWWHQAACLDEPLTTFFNPDGARMSTLPALAICATCPVQQACLDDALREERHTSGGRYGVRGGMTAEQRSTLARQPRTDSGGAR